MIRMNANKKEIIPAEIHYLDRGAQAILPMFRDIYLRSNFCI